MDGNMDELINKWKYGWIDRYIKRCMDKYVWSVFLSTTRFLS